MVCLIVSLKPRIQTEKLYQTELVLFLALLENSAHGLRQLTRDVKQDARTLNFRSDVTFAPAQKKKQLTFGKGRDAM